MTKIICCILIVLSLSSCSSILHSTHKIQSDKRLRKTEDRNFAGEKAQTQWWYFDFFLEDGSALVVLFAPYHWWEDKADSKSIVYISYLNKDGELTVSNKVFDAKEVQFDLNNLNTPYLDIVKSHSKDNREYTLQFKTDEIYGSAKITTDQKGFSPLPTGSLGSFGAKHFLKQQGNVAYRYAAHVPKGDAIFDLKIGSDQLNLSGQAYHEQGWFTGEAQQMGEGWEWFHFKSESINLFGARSFFYLEMNGELLVGGLNSFNSKCRLTDEVFSVNTSNFILAGKLTFSSPKLSFDVIPAETLGTPLIYIPANETDQLWGTTLQKSQIKINRRGVELLEAGNLIIETCRMSKIKLQNEATISDDFAINPIDKE